MREQILKLIYGTITCHLKISKRCEYSPDNNFVLGHNYNYRFFCAKSLNFEKYT